MSSRYAIPATKEYNELHFDWISMTYPLEALARFFGISEDSVKDNIIKPKDLIDLLLAKVHLNTLVRTPSNTGIDRYSSKFFMAGTSITIGFNKEYIPENDPYFGSHNSVMIQMEGDGVKTARAVFDVIPDYGIFEFLKLSKRMGGRATRLDLADDFFNYSHFFSPLYLYQRLRAGEIRTKFRSWLFVSSGKIKGIYHFKNPKRYCGKHEGSTLYLGENPKQIRFYNKKAEMYANKNIDFSCKSWSRWEFQLNRPYADEWLNQYLENSKVSDNAFQNCYLGILKDTFAVLKRTKDKNKSRWPLADYYKNYLGNVNRINLRYEHEKPSVERQIAWYEHEVRNTVKTMVFAKAQAMVSDGICDNFEEGFKKEIGKLADDLLHNPEIHSNPSLINSYLVEHDEDLMHQDLNSLSDEINSLHFDGEK